MPTALLQKETWFRLAQVANDNDTYKKAYDDICKQWKDDLENSAALEIDSPNCLGYNAKSHVLFYTWVMDIPDKSAKLFKNDRILVSTNKGEANRCYVNANVHVAKKNNNWTVTSPGSVWISGLKLIVQKTTPEKIEKHIAKKIGEVNPDTIMKSPNVKIRNGAIYSLRIPNWSIDKLVKLVLP